MVNRTETGAIAVGAPNSIARVINDPDKLITVCSSCLCASCWQGEFYCDNYKSAGTIDLPVKKLLELNKESPSYWKD